MTPKEKAEQLYLKFSYAIRDEETSEGYFSNALHSKNCALIAVDEIIDEVKKILDDEIYSSVLIYWLKVKQEIEKL
jgi:hypothetical protein